ncbi:beta and beta-prime subunits of DNA dependent RNA-polymerase [Atractiella rhizophila]|nr:beta and beta-prime subunits of DNA dependent RNA-polymerase [Atractiella rhizophila]
MPSIDRSPSPSASPKKSKSSHNQDASLDILDELSTSTVHHSFGTLKLMNTFKNPSTVSTDFPALDKLVEPHIQSFNLLFDGVPSIKGEPSTSKGLLDVAVKHLKNVVVWDGRPAGNDLPFGNKLEFRINRVQVAKPTFENANVTRKYFPASAREGLRTYGGIMTVDLGWRCNNGSWVSKPFSLGKLPIMVRSSRCHLAGMSSKQLVEAHEETNEMGGYFIINGNERLIRYLIVPRRNHFIALIRNSFTGRGPSFSPYGVQIRCVRPDQSSQTNTLHYLNTGTIVFRFSWRKQEYMIPVILLLKALGKFTDKDIFLGLIQNDFQNTFLTDRVELLLRSFKNYNLHTASQCLHFLGGKFRTVLNVPEDWSDEKVGDFLLNQVLLVHLSDWTDKFRLLILMIRKLYALLGGSCCQDDPDSAQNQEVLLPGFLINMIIKEKLEEFMGGIRAQMVNDVRRDNPRQYQDQDYVERIVNRLRFDIGAKIEHFLATGNLFSPSGLDLSQAAGFTIIADKLNFYRYISHFRCIHRGAFFTTQRTTTVRKLRPESWGFLCPVHTPDGTPCGLLNHLSHQCRIVTSMLDASSLVPLLLSLGMTQAWDPNVLGDKMGPVLLDGRIVGWAQYELTRKMAAAIRFWKTERMHDIPLDLEIGLIPPVSGGQFPGLYFFSTPARMMRPVKFAKTEKLDSIGPFEQVYMDIAVQEEDWKVSKGSHVEYAPTNVLSVLANMTPFSDFNQSPRNMYQCQMSKQTMGTPSNAIIHRTDNKLYRLQTGQTPVVRPALHDHYGLDAFPNGTNAVVAVISYTGYDMEDAMILNKSAHERGFAHGSIYKTQIVDIRDVKADKDENKNTRVYFKLGDDTLAATHDPTHPYAKIIDKDGLPFPGVRIKTGDPICAYFDEVRGRTRFQKYKGDETCYVDQVRIIGSEKESAEAERVHIKLRVARGPVIGDKFSSRHGQKGVCSQKYPAIDMPFSESGMQPDVIINPHAFPSRMTIGMFVESLAGKSGSLHGIAQDATPFKFNEEDTPLDYFGEQLLKAGYNYYGNEPMYSGVTGEEFAADIYIGVVYYQRLRHMVGDKWQVRTTGPVDQVTRQPIKGRKKGGGIRFGEMERDALIAHGTAFLLQDRLMNCSDYATVWACRRCGSLISLGKDERAQKKVDVDETAAFGELGEYCRICRAAGKEGQPLKKGRDGEITLGNSGSMELVALPFVFSYLVGELAAMGLTIKVGLD